MQLLIIKRFVIHWSIAIIWLQLINIHSLPWIPIILIEWEMTVYIWCCISSGIYIWYIYGYAYTADTWGMKKYKNRFREDWIRWNHWIMTFLRNWAELELRSCVDNGLHIRCFWEYIFRVENLESINPGPVFHYDFFPGWIDIAIGTKSFSIFIWIFLVT